MSNERRGGAGEQGSGIAEPPEEGGRELAYLCIDAFMQDIFSSRALLTAFETGLVDFLVAHPSASSDSLAGQLGFDGGALELLLGFLARGGVVSRSTSGVELTEAFKAALEFRDLLVLKLSLARAGAHDLLDHFTEMVRLPRQSIGKLPFCRLFNYERALRDTEENYEWTKRWMAITTGLTRYEARVCMKYHDFRAYSRILDIGGNSGEFLLEVCRQQAGVHGVVVDLPVVCRIGREHLAHQPEAGRIGFVEGDALTDELPSGFDLVTFKSMLHDWPDKQARQLLANGSRSLREGGTLLIFERAPLDAASGSFSFSTVPFLLFFGAFRSSSLYEDELGRLGFRGIETLRVDLDSPFHLITATKCR